MQAQFSAYYEPAEANDVDWIQPLTVCKNGYSDKLND